MMFKILSFAIVITLILFSCNKYNLEHIDFPQLDARLSNKFQNAIELEGQISGILSGDITEHGHCWSKVSQLPTLQDEHTSLGVQNNEAIYYSRISSLTVNENYYGRAYMVFNDSIYYSDPLIFNLSNYIVNTDSVRYKNGTRGILAYAKVVGQELGVNVLQHGFCWAKEESNLSFSQSNCSQLGPINESTFNFAELINDLENKTNYFIRAYAIINQDTILGEIINFQTDYKEIWIQQNNFSGEAKSFFSTFTVNGKGYLCFGYSGGIAIENEVWEYDLDLDQWEQKADFPGEERGFAIVEGMNSKAYVGLGSGAGPTEFDDFWEYDPIMDSWEMLENYPGEPRSGSFSFTHENNIYIGGGHDCDFTDFWSYDTDNESWSQLEDFPGQSRNSAIDFKIGNKAYVGMGTYCGIELKDIWSYDFEDETWEFVTWYPQTHEPFSGGIAEVVNEVCYMGLGVADAGQPNNIFWSFNPNGNIWELKESFTNNNVSFAGSFTLNENIYVVEGLNLTTGLGALPRVWKFSLN